jgi:hypothetical protein
LFVQAILSSQRRQVAPRSKEMTPGEEANATML